ncbi:MAG: hypothetical protein E7388_02745 [Ruminococcaceae bacterium]|nr:hypothetical protein [Oscillospiraceae bacterium]
MYFGSGNFEVVALVIAVISAIAATILAFIFILPEKKKDKLKGLGKLLHNVGNFKSLIIEKILQAVYVFLTCASVIYGFLNLFSVRQSIFGGVYWNGGMGLLIMIVGPIVIRLAFEMTMMFILLVKNVIQINNKLKSSSDGNIQEDAFSVPVFNNDKTEPAQPQPEAAFCTNRGSQLVNGVCPYCQGGYYNYSNYNQNYNQ